MDKALLATLKYLKRPNQNTTIATTEEKLARLWLDASRKVAAFNPELSEAMHFKGMGWVDNPMWDLAHNRGVNTSIEGMQVARQLLSRAYFKEESMTPVPSWFPIAGAAFLLLTIGFFMYIYVSPPAGGANIVLSALTGFCAAASFGGSAAAEGKVPFLKNSPLSFTVGGGIAVFVIVLVLMSYLGRASA